MSQKEEQKNKIIEFQILNQEVQKLQEQLQNINNSIQELQILRNTLEELKSIKKDQEILIPLGQGILIKGNIKDSNKLITNVGSNILIEKSLDETKDMIKVNILNISRVMERTEEEIQKKVERLQELQKEIIKQEKQ